MFESHFWQIGLEIIRFYLGNTRSEKMTARNCASIVNVNKDGERICDTDVHEAPYHMTLFLTLCHRCTFNTKNNHGVVYGVVFCIKRAPVHFVYYDTSFR
jgi:hypothetical protein